MKAHRYRLKPSLEQQEQLAVQFGCARYVYNWALANKTQRWKEDQYSLSRYELQTLLVRMKQQTETLWLKQAHSQVLQSALLHLDQAFKNFFAGRACFPQCKKKHGQQSCQYPQGVKMEGNKVFLPKVGWVKAVIHREPMGTIKTVTISKDNTGQYYASVLFDTQELAIPPAQHVEHYTGLDAGIAQFMTNPDGASIPNPRFLERQLPNLRRKQQKLSRKQKGSHNRAKARLLVAKAHQAVANARTDFHHQHSKRIVDENQAVFIEDLKIKNLLKNKRIARSLLDIGWHSFTTKLAYKLKDRGGYLIKVPAHYTSQTCSSCDHVSKDNRKTQAHFVCVACGFALNADHNAAINIQRRGILKLKAAGITVSACGGLGQPFWYQKAPAVEAVSPIHSRSAA